MFIESPFFLDFLVQRRAAEIKILHEHSRDFTVSLLETEPEIKKIRMSRFLHKLVCFSVPISSLLIHMR